MGDTLLAPHWQSGDTHASPLGTANASFNWPVKVLSAGCIVSAAQLYIVDSAEPSLVWQDVTEETAEVFLQDKVSRGLVHPSVAAVKTPELPHLPYAHQARASKPCLLKHENSGASDWGGLWLSVLLYWWGPASALLGLCLMHAADQHSALWPAACSCMAT